jgi:hypothetical protein
MNWDAIGAIAEMASSLVVVITVAYLAVQIKQSSKSARSVSTNQARAAVTDVLSAISSDTEAVKVYTTGQSKRSEMELHERVRFDLIIFQTLRIIETIFLEYQEGLVPKEVWEGQWRGEQSILRTKGGRESWDIQKTFVAKSFMDWVDRNLDID